MLAFHPPTWLSTTKFEREMKPDLNLPRSSDKPWEVINKKLEIKIPKIFTEKRVQVKTYAKVRKQQIIIWLKNTLLQKNGFRLFAGTINCLR